MAETEKTVVEANAVNPQADAPKKNAVPSETSPLSNSAEDLGPAVVKPTDSNPDATKKSSKVSDAVNAKATDGDTTSKSDTDGKVTKVAHPGQTLKVEDADADDKEISEGEMPDGLKKYLAKKDGKDTKAEDEDKSKTTDSEKMKKEVKEDVDALLAGEETLSEEFKAKAATIFEAAITSKVKAIAEEIEADQKSKFEEELNSMKATLTEKIDSYLNYVVEEWMKENKIAVERGIKGEIAEDFIGGLKKLFEDHYIDVPDEKYDVLEDQATKIDELEKKLNEQIEKNVELNSKSGDLMKEQIRNEVAADLADTQKEKFNKLSEEIEFTNAEDFRKKVETVKESYFNKKSTTGEQIDDVAATDGDSVNEDLSTAMAAYSAAISKTKDIKLVS
jgi:hypothetical protein|tara:strand:- start:123 stop:1295 length:1173 start_codon:yes stop_codon:yes gene_type:complete